MPEVEFIETNADYAHVKLMDGHETTISIGTVKPQIPGLFPKISKFIPIPTWHRENILLYRVMTWNIKMKISNSLCPLPIRMKNCPLEFLKSQQKFSENQ